MDVIKQFIHDMIHMTKGEKLINYWWLWLSILVVSLFIAFVIEKVKGR
jgi:hypothetical protein